VEYYYNNKYKSNRQFLRDRLYNQETAAISERFSGQTASGCTAGERPGSYVSDGESGSDCGGSTPTVPVGTVASSSKPVVASVASTGGKLLPKRMRKPETSSWCTTCVVTRPSVLPCAWSLCGNTVCRTCYAQHASQYRARPVGDSWKTGVLNPFWLCLQCTDGVPVPESGPQHATRPKIVVPGVSSVAGSVDEKVSVAPPSATPLSAPPAPKPPIKPDSKKRKRPVNPCGGSSGKVITSRAELSKGPEPYVDMPRLIVTT
jgi:hypothetical protein